MGSVAGGTGGVLSPEAVQFPGEVVDLRHQRLVTAKYSAPCVPAFTASAPVAETRAVLAKRLAVPSQLGLLSWVRRPRMSTFFLQWVVWQLGEQKRCVPRLVGMYSSWHRLHCYSRVSDNRAIGVSV